MNLLNLTSRSDIIGATASILCFVHCVATPFIFVAHAGLALGEESHPWWWGTLDIVFLVISFFAVYWSSRTTSKTWVKFAFWFFWLFLSLFLMNERLGFMHLSEELIYLPTVGLILLHFYNRRHCRHADDSCYTEKS